MDIITLRNLEVSYNQKSSFYLKINHLCFKKGDKVFIKGPSGAGKTTFLNVLTALHKTQKGQISILGKNIKQFSASQADSFRADHFGIIFQTFHLLPYLSVIENIILPCQFSKLKHQRVLKKFKSLEQAAMQLCKHLDLSDDIFKTPISNLSIGQKQRVAIARSLIGQPEIILADEPSSALDDERKEQFIKLLLKECEIHEKTLIFVSHDQSLEGFFDKIYLLNQDSLLKKKVL